MESISSTNLKQLLDFYVKNKRNIKLKDIIDYYTPIPGYLYCMFNEVFKYYGDDVYKFVNSAEPDKRLNGYTTSYINPYFSYINLLL